MSDAEHWLWRLSPDEWLAAARIELEQGADQLGARRTAVTHARRAAGMALNGVLVTMAGRGWPRSRCETAWGRSYIDHLRILAAAANDEQREPFDAELSERCRTLLAISVMPPTGLVTLAARKDAAATEAIELATVITRTCAAVIGS